MRPSEIAVADYIASLWGKRRREFARRYWAHLAYGMRCPDFTACFGSYWIADRLIDFAQADTWWQPPWKDPDHLREGM